MKKYLKYINLFFTICFLFCVFFVSAPTATAMDYGLENTAKTGFGVSSVSELEADIPSAIGTFVGALLSFIGVLFFILMVYGGFLWMTAQGNEDQVTKAKNLIIAAVIGIIIVMSAYAITAYVGGTLTGSSTTETTGG